MIVGIIGSGGREHAICTKIKESPKISKIFCIPGNAGTSEISENLNVGIATVTRGSLAFEKEEIFKMKTNIIDILRTKKLDNDK